MSKTNDLSDSPFEKTNFEKGVEPYKVITDEANKMKLVPNTKNTLEVVIVNERSKAYRIVKVSRAFDDLVRGSGNLFFKK